MKFVQPVNLDKAIRDSSKLAMQLANELGISYTLLSDWRTGLRVVPTYHVEKLAFLLDVTTESLFRESEPEQISTSVERPIDPRATIQFGMDGMPMVPIGPKILCSCGRVVNP